MAEKKGKPRRWGSGPTARIILVLFLVGVIWQLHGLNEQVAAAEAEKARYEAQVDALRRKNNELAADIAEGATREKLEEVARKELGVVGPGEYVFSHRGN